jgi:hypothetical protein
VAKHKRPSKVVQNARRTGTAVAGSTVALAVSASPALASGEWDVIAQCESGGQNIESHSTASSASGYFQIIDGTWAGAGGLEFAPRAIDATFEEQAIVAQRIAERRGSLADWNASKGCWGDQISSAVPAPKPEPKPAPAKPTDVDCKDFDFRQDAQAVLVEDTKDPFNLDSDNDGKACEALPQAKRYTVQKGDWLSTIAPRIGMTTQELYLANKEVIGDNPDLIFPGQVFFVGGLPLPTAPVTIEEETVVEEAAGEEEVTTETAAVPDSVVAFINNSAGPVSSRAQAAANSVFTNVRGASLIDIGGTRASARDMAGHPSGNALDYMVLGDAGLGDAILAYHKAHWADLGVQYVIWQQKYYDSPTSAGSFMEDRGSVTQNHYDHVHVNYN